MELSSILEMLTGFEPTGSRPDFYLEKNKSGKN